MGIVMNANNEEKLGKTPTRFSGLRPDSYNFEEQFYSWSKPEQLKYLEYFERDTTRYSGRMGLFFGSIIGAILMALVFIYLVM